MALTKKTIDFNATLKSRYINLCGGNRKSIRRDMIGSAIKKLQSDIEKCQHWLVISLRELEEKQMALQATQEKNPSTSHLEDEFDQLLKHPDINKLDIQNEKIIVYTNSISIAFKKSAYKIGKFEIEIYTDGSRGGVRMFNHTYPRHGPQHPHVNEDGIPCLGNIKEVVPNLIAERKYSALIAICIQYLKSYENSGDNRPYELITGWPKKKGGKK